MIPGAGIVSAAVSSVTSLGDPGGNMDVTKPLSDGVYLLAVVVARPLARQKSPLTGDGHSAAAARRQIRIVMAFVVESGRLKTKHDTVKNSINNVR